MKSFWDFCLPRSLQRVNGTSFTSKVTQGVSKALGITYYLHCAWRPQSSGKVERANQFLESVIKKITQQTSLTLLHTCIAPKEQGGLSLYEMLYGKTFVYVNDLFLDPEAQTLHSYTMPTGQFQQDVHLWGVNQDPKILKSHNYMLQELKSQLKFGKMGPQRLNSSPHERAPTL